MARIFPRLIPRPRGPAPIPHPLPRGTPPPSGNPTPPATSTPPRSNPISNDTNPAKLVFVTKSGLLRLIQTAQAQAVKQINDDIARRITSTQGALREGAISRAEYNRGIDDLKRERLSLLRQQNLQYSEAIAAYKRTRPVKGQVELRIAGTDPFTGRIGILNTGYTF